MSESVPPVPPLPENSLPIKESEEANNSLPVESGPVFKKKEYVFTDRRKENLLKANKARKENGELKKQLKLKYDLAAKELQTLYEHKLAQLHNSGENIINPVKIEMSAIPVESVVKEDVKKGKKQKRSKKQESDSDSSSDSEPEVATKKKRAKLPTPPPPTQPSSDSSDSDTHHRRKKIHKKTKKVKYIIDSDDSSDSDGPSVARNRGKKGRKSRRSEKYVSESSESEEERPSKADRYMERKTPFPNYYLQNPSIGQHSGCRF